ncbi:hypothetical protein GCM10027294_43840 [Marinactinospora endophytica]
MEPDLADDQWEIGGLILGRGRPLAVEDWSVGDVEARLGDVDRAGGDGREFGYDYHGGRTLTLEVFTDTTTAAASRDAAAALHRVWDAPAVRATPRAVMPLRVRLPGAPTVMTVYGRPRRLSTATLRGRPDGVADYVATFDTVDSAWYGDLRTVTLSLLPDLSGGLTLPALLPVRLEPIGNANADLLVNEGDTVSWPMIEFTGPITNPEITWVGTDISLRLVTTIPHDRTVTIDTRPWARTILRSDGASLAGAKRGVLLEDLRLPPGRTEVAFRGQDPTGASSATIRWRDAYSTP